MNTLQIRARESARLIIGDGILVDATGTEYMQLTLASAASLRFYLRRAPVKMVKAVELRIRDETVRLLVTEGQLLMACGLLVAPDNESDQALPLYHGTLRRERGVLTFYKAGAHVALTTTQVQRDDIRIFIREVLTWVYGA